MPTPTRCLFNGFQSKVRLTDSRLISFASDGGETRTICWRAERGRELQPSGNSARSANKSWPSGSGFATGKRRPIEPLSDQFPRG